jgi:hypothetical protein
MLLPDQDDHLLNGSPSLVPAPIVQTDCHTRWGIPINLNHSLSCQTIEAFWLTAPSALALLSRVGSTDLLGIRDTSGADIREGGKGEVLAKFCIWTFGLQLAATTMEPRGALAPMRYPGGSTSSPLARLPFLVRSRPTKMGRLR